VTVILQQLVKQKNQQPPLLAKKIQGPAAVV
jgi:hypothetical protein